jgi:probable phosphoglycerate mutase
LPAASTAVVVTHSATAMALSSALLGLDPGFPVLGPLANCHWTELSCESDSGWRLRAHNIGVPGVVVPVPVRGDVTDEAPDAEA